MTLVRVAAEGGGEADALFHWLRADAELARCAVIESGPAHPGQMGALEIINVVLSQATALSGLAVAVSTWRRTRPTSPAVTITRTDGQTLTIPAGGHVDAEVIDAFLTVGEVHRPLDG